MRASVCGWLLAPLVALALVACGDDDAPRSTVDDCPPGVAASADLLDQLRAAPCVAAAVEYQSEQPGYRVFDLRFTQRIDHQDPASATFTQQATLLVRDPGAPTVLVSTGYANYYGQGLSELAYLLRGNQLVVEHRYFGTSIPESPDWTRLTIESAADDHHQVIDSLAAILAGPWLSTGASKGGMTSVYHRRYWPDDVVGTVPYVAPLSRGAPDDRYDAFVDGLGPPACRAALEALEVELLSNRRAALEARATAQAEQGGLQYTRVALPAAVEGAVTSIYWAFWQYVGAGACEQVPAPTASDDALWGFLEQVSSVADFEDARIAYFEAYDYQAEFELGYPGTDDTWLDGLLQFGDADYAGFLPVGVELPSFRPEAMADIDAWVQADGAELLFVYGGWDPWSGGQFELGAARDSARYVVAEATHGAQLLDLPAAERDAAMAMLAGWTGVTPTLPADLAPRHLAPAPPRLPPPLRARRAGSPSRLPGHHRP